MKLKTFIGHAPVLLLAGAGFPSASVAAPRIKTVAVSGSIANGCSLATTSVSVDLKITSNGSSKVFTPTPTTVAAACNSPSGGTLSVTATNATKSGGSAVYTFTVSGWGGTAKTVTSSASATPTPTIFTTSDYTSVNVAFSGFSTATTTTGNYTGTITLGLAPRP